MRPLKLIPDNTNIDFLRWRTLAMGLSVLLIIASIALVATRGLNLGVDFVGGQVVRATLPQPVPLDQVRARVDALGLGDAAVQQFGSPRDVSIRLPLPAGGDEAANAAADRVRAGLTRAFPGARIASVDTVSGKVSGELFSKGAWALALAMLGVSLYIWLRFEWQFGVGALFSLFHDVALTLGFFSLTWLEFDLNIVAAILTIIGYSLNDTIVVYDRVRENLRKYRKMEIIPLLNLSTNETLSRTIVTSLSLIMALAALVFLGPAVIFGFSLAMLLGIVIGTYSSIYIANPILIWTGVTGATFVTNAATKGPAAGAERVGPRSDA
ncbi:MAG TPA: protein translocase subunit SecF [Sphingomonas sp.]|uniref:protein translocase subunit SecF n=1 Tax=Sphingomonas sp. TaxID=28214 RepID=UPI002EDBAEEC